MTEDPRPALAEAVAHFQAGRYEAAIQGAQALLGSGHRTFGLLYLLGLSTARRGESAVAEAWLAQALAINPTHAEALKNRGVLLKQLGRLAEALASYDAALAARPDFAEAHAARANALLDAGRPRDALAAFERTGALAPGDPQAAIGAGRARQALADDAGALEAYTRATALDRASGAAWAGRAAALSNLRRWGEASEAYARAADLDPTQPALLGQALHAQLKLCDWTDFQPRLACVVGGLDAGRLTSTPFALLPLPCTAQQEKRGAELYTAATQADASARPAGPDPSADGRIRVGYFSADFHNHATAYLVAEFLELHDRAAFEVVGFSFGPRRDDAMRRRLVAGMDRFFDVAGLDDAAVAEMSRGLGIDIAVDLKGYTFGARVGIFAHRAAPVQVNYLGYPGTMGAGFMDYIVADPVVIPPDRLDGYTEKVAWLDGCYQPNDRRRPRPEARTGREDHGLPPTGFVFGCFNNNYKITPDVFAVWMRLLQAVDGAVLWLFQDNPAAAAKLREAAADHGVDPARLVFAVAQPLEAHLERHRHMDLFLDTSPYNAHTTASDALWMDVPLVTTPTDTFAGRVAASLLSAAGVPDLIAPSWADYEALALGLARDPARLSAIRTRLARGRPESRLFDTPRFTRELEDLYRAMHRRRLQGLPPDHIGPQR